MHLHSENKKSKPRKVAIGISSTIFILTFGLMIAIMINNNEETYKTEASTYEIEEATLTSVTTTNGDKYEISKSRIDNIHKNTNEYENTVVITKSYFYDKLGKLLIKETKIGFDIYLEENAYNTVIQELTNTIYKREN